MSAYDLWDTYLPAFRELVVKAKVHGVMCAYNRVDNQPCCGNNELLHYILRNQWGFDGYVTSDCWAISDFAKLRLTPDLLPLPDGLSLVREADGAWRLEWAVVPGLPGAAADDYLKVFLMRDGETFNPECIVAGDACRADGRAVFRVPEALDDYRHLFIVFCSQAGAKSSESRYFDLYFYNYF